MTQIWHFWHVCIKLTSGGLKKFQQKINLPPEGIEHTTLTNTGLEV